MTIHTEMRPGILKPREHRDSIPVCHVRPFIPGPSRIVPYSDSSLEGKLFRASCTLKTEFEFLAPFRV